MVIFSSSPLPNRKFHTTSEIIAIGTLRHFAETEHLCGQKHTASLTELFGNIRAERRSQAFLITTYLL